MRRYDGCVNPVQGQGIVRRVLGRFIRRTSENLGRFGNTAKIRVAEQNETAIRNVVAFSLYGNHPRYVRGGMQNIETYSRWFPEFVCRFCVGSDVDPNVIRAFRSQGAEVFVMEARGQ